MDKQSSTNNDVISVLEVWEAIGHDGGVNPSKGELLDSLRNMAAICDAHGNDMPAQSAIDQRKVIADAITGALAFGALASRPPAEDHWLRPFYDLGAAEGQRTRDLAMLVRMLASALKRHAPDSNLVERAANYLAARGLVGTPLRSALEPEKRGDGDERAAFEACCDYVIDPDAQRVCEVDVTPGKEAELPEVVAYADPIAFATFKERGHEGGAVGREWMWAEPSAGLVAMSRTDECERVVGALLRQKHEADTALAWATRHYQTVEQQRDAALAKLAELEKQEPAATVAKVPGEDWNSLDFHLDLQGMLPGTKLYTTPVAQAPRSDHSELRRIAVALKNPLLSGDEASDLMVRYEALTMPDHIIALIDSLAQHSLAEPTAIHQWQFSNAWFDGSEDVVLKAGREGSPIRTLYTAPIDQAQHGVPLNAAALVAAEGRKYSLNAAGMFDSGAPDHAQTIAIVQLLSEFDDEEAENNWEAIRAYSDLRAANALWRVAELLNSAPGRSQPVEAQYSAPAELRAICMLVAEAGIKYGRGRHRAVASDECREVVDSVLPLEPSPSNSEPHCVPEIMAAAEGILTFMRSEKENGSQCTCCNGPHIFCRYFEGMSDFDDITRKARFRNDLEGRTFRLVLELLPPRKEVGHE
ncbi:hypothetical protein [Pseudomonas aeruginosa]|uniref:hypothetical protein n=1 Tax=Pseudomonas aeruginosa TaxID=287 RepID=UPI00229EC45F|nr:hypothetical protein [Pseudomonas aeruginosa]HCT4814159.1 hypothetical protein [Pseudomonas aeruginosa]